MSCVVVHSRRCCASLHRAVLLMLCEGEVRRVRLAFCVRYNDVLLRDDVVFVLVVLGGTSTVTCILLLTDSTNICIYYGDELGLICLSTLPHSIACVHGRWLLFLSIRHQRRGHPAIHSCRMFLSIDRCIG